MKCPVCTSRMNPYFKKNFNSQIHEYIKCEKCGLVVNETIYNMTDVEWTSLNEWHFSYQGTEECKEDPRWISRLKVQADLLTDMFDTGILNYSDINIDFGCGSGELSNYINERYQKRHNCKLQKNLLQKYDEYMTPEGVTDYISKEDLKKHTCDFVISCSVFEHLIGMQNVDKILSLASDNAIVGIHTLVCEEVPQDYNWFYLVPVHCTFWTNKAMSVLYEKYGYKGYAYHVEGQLWFFFKSDRRYEEFKKKYAYIGGTWILSDTFVDYWKEKPYRKDELS